MILIQSSGSSPALAMLSVLLRLVGIIVCVNKAGELNRNKTGWGIFGFLIPIVAMIWVYNIKKKVEWKSE